MISLAPSKRGTGCSRVEGGCGNAGGTESSARAGVRGIALDRSRSMIHPPVSYCHGQEPRNSRSPRGIEAPYRPPHHHGGRVPYCAKTRPTSRRPPMVVPEQSTEALPTRQACVARLIGRFDGMVPESLVIGTAMVAPRVIQRSSIVGESDGVTPDWRRWTIRGVRGDLQRQPLRVLGRRFPRLPGAIGNKRKRRAPWNPSFRMLMKPLRLHPKGTA
jgi:hypothetical protein